MQALFLLFVTLGLSAASHLTLLPYAYLADPLPVYHQSQDTRTGEHAYSYAGGPSAKEEVKGLDGVTRGSYSYVDANGILQSVFYVADEAGFRVAATNLPGDDDLSIETGDVLLARNVRATTHGNSSNRKKRSLDESQQNSNQAQAEEKIGNSQEKIADQSPSETVHTAVLGVPDSVLIPKLVTTATSHQSQVQIHKKVQLEAEPLLKIAAEPVYEHVILPSEIPLATSHQSHVQIHKNARVEVPEPEATVKVKEPVDVVHAPLTPIVPVTTFKGYQVNSVPVVAALPSYHENRIQFHKNIGIEGPAAKSAVKLHNEPVAVVPAQVSAVPVLSTVIAKEAVPVVVPSYGTASVTTSISSHGVSQVHGNSKVDVVAPVLSEPTLYFKSAPISQVQSIFSLPLFRALPYAHASLYRTQIHAK